MSNAQEPIVPGTVVELAIHDLNSEGEGVGRAEGVVVFVPGAVPGDRIQARVKRLVKNRVEAELVEISEPSPRRVEPPCPYQSDCGGCPLMVLEPEAALESKVSHLAQVLRRIGKVETEIETVVPSPRQLEYRGRVRFAVAGRGLHPQIGYRGRGASESFVGIERCLLIDAQAVSLAVEVLDRLDQRIPPDSTWPTHVTMRTTAQSGRWLVALHTSEGPLRGANRALSELLEEQPLIAGVSRVLERKSRTLGERVLAGSPTLSEQFCGVEVEVGATTFLQVNLEAAERLYQQVKELLAEGPPARRLLDLYCGVGLLGLSVTSPEIELVGVESQPASIAQAREIATRMGRERVRFRQAECVRAMQQLVRNKETFDHIVINPPRSGAGKGAARFAWRLGAKVVILVSCHPAALARDLASFQREGFLVQQIRAVDMFPQTTHLESVARLVRDESFRPPRVRR